MQIHEQLSRMLEHFSKVQKTLSCLRSEVGRLWKRDRCHDRLTELMPEVQPYWTDKTEGSTSIPRFQVTDVYGKSMLKRCRRCRGKATWTFACSTWRAKSTSRRCWMCRAAINKVSRSVRSGWSGGQALVEQDEHLQPSFGLPGD